MKFLKSDIEFDKTDIVKMGGTAIVTALLITGIILFTSEGPLFSFEVGNNFTSTSERISIDSARILAKEYAGFKNHLKVRYDSPIGSGDYRIDTLRGFIIKAKQLDEIINHNRNPRRFYGTKEGDTVKYDSTADDVIFYFGKQGGFNYRLKGRANMHIIAVGIKNDTLMINPKKTNDSTAASVFDKASPCPGSPGCPPIVPK